MALPTLYYLPQFRTTALNVPGGLTAAQTTGIILSTIPSDLDISLPGIICLTYANPLVTANAEYITYTSIDGSNTLQGVTRGAEGYAAKTHLDQAVVAFIVSKSHVNNLNNLLRAVTTGPALLRPAITTSIDDSSNNEVIKTPATASAVNELTVTNSATGNAVQISATGDDTNISLSLVAKGTGTIKIDVIAPVTANSAVKISSQYGIITSDTDGATITFDCSVSNRHIVILGGNRTLAISNATSGQIIILELVQDGTGSRTVTWFVGPALTVTMTIATPGVVTSGQDIPTGTPVVFTTTGALPTGLVAGTTYWWTRVNATTGNVSTSFANCQAGTLIATSGSQSGVHTMKTAIRWASQTAPTLSTGKFTGDIFNIYIRDAAAGVYEGLVAGQGI